MATQEIDDFHVDLAGQHHLHNFHGGLICDPDSVAKLGFNTQTLEHLIDLGSPTMHNDWVETHIFQEHDVLSESLFQRPIGHCMTAIFNDNGLALERTNVGQGFDQDVCLLNQSVHIQATMAKDTRKTRNPGRGRFRLACLATLPSWKESSPTVQRSW